MRIVRTCFPAESKKTILSGTRVFFIQNPPEVAVRKTKSIPSEGARLRNMSPRPRCAAVSASSGWNTTPSSRRFAVAGVVARCGRCASDDRDRDRAWREPARRHDRPRVRVEPLRRDGDGHALHRVVHVAAEVPRRLERLLAAGLVARGSTARTRRARHPTRTAKSATPTDPTSYRARLTPTSLHRRSTHRRQQPRRRPTTPGRRARTRLPRRYAHE